MSSSIRISSSQDHVQCLLRQVGYLAGRQALSSSTGVLAQNCWSLLCSFEFNDRRAKRQEVLAWHCNRHCASWLAAWHITSAAAQDDALSARTPHLMHYCSCNSTVTQAIPPLGMMQCGGRWLQHARNIQAQKDAQASPIKLALCLC